jgi:ATP-dependent exoDNAse (exonuclease V) beta subunit
MALRPLRDPRLKFYAKSHVYKLGRKKLRSVTEWISQFYPKFDAKEQAKRSSKNPNSKYYGMKMREILALWKNKTDDGTETHAQIEQFLITGAVPTDPKAQHALTVIDELWQRLELSSASSFPEVRVYSEELGLAGTIDWVVMTEGGLMLYDWKTNGTLAFSLDKYKDQLNTYAHIVEREYGQQIIGLRLVHLTDTGAEVIVIERNEKRIQELIERDKHESK